MRCRIFPTSRRASDLRNRGPATRRQLRLDARPLYRPRGRSKPSKGFVAKAVGEGEAAPKEQVDPRVEQLLRRLHSRTLESRSPASQPVGNFLLSQSVPGCVRTSQRTRRLPPAAQSNTPTDARGRPPRREWSAGNGIWTRTRVLRETTNLRPTSKRSHSPTEPVYRTSSFDGVGRPREPVRRGIFRRLLDADHETAVRPIPRKLDGRT